MKNKKIHILILIILIILIISLIYFFLIKKPKETENIEEKVYSSSGIKFKSNNFFQKVSNEKFDLSYIDPLNNIMVLGVQETKKELKKMKLEINSLKDYVEALYKKQNNTLTDIEKRNNYYYFTYSYKTENNEEFYYLIAAYETNDNYYTVNFTCPYNEKDKYTSALLELADTIKVT